MILSSRKSAKKIIVNIFFDICPGKKSYRCNWLYTRHQMIQHGTNSCCWFGKFQSRSYHPFLALVLRWWNLHWRLQPGTPLKIYIFRHANFFEGLLTDLQSGRRAFGSPRARRTWASSHLVNTSAWLAPRTPRTSRMTAEFFMFAVECVLVRTNICCIVPRGIYIPAMLQFCDSGRLITAKIVSYYFYKLSLLFF